MSERINDSGKSGDLNENTWELFNGYKSVSFLLLVTVATILLLREYRIYQSNPQRSNQLDNDLSHAANLRFEDIFARLEVIEDKLDLGRPGGPVEEEEEVAVEEETEEQTPASTYSSRRSRSRATTEETE